MAGFRSRKNAISKADFSVLPFPILIFTMGFLFSVILCLLAGLHPINGAAAFTNTSQFQADYIVRWTSKCTGIDPVVPHFTVTSGSVCTLDGDPLTALAQNQSRDFAVGLNASAGISTWRSWIDTTLEYQATTASSTLVELTRDDRSGNSQYFTDISLVDALTSSLVVIPPKTNCTQHYGNQTTTICRSISCVPPDDWQCPLQNRFSSDNQGQYLSHTYLSAEQSCLSNCTVHRTDEACCAGQYANPKTCSNKNPELKKACDEAYSYAFDDQSATYVWSLPLDSVALIEIIACA